MNVPVSLPEYAAKYLGAEVAIADLLFRNGSRRLHVVVTRPAPEAAASDTVVGVDLESTRPAVTSANGFYGERRWRELEARDFRLRP